MSKQEFIEGLRRSLSSINDYTFVNDTISYYENYIETQMRMGKTEEEVMAQLGDPRLIAKSIRATHVSDEAQEQEEYREFNQETYAKKRNVTDTVFGFNGKQIRMPVWFTKVVGMLVLLLVFFVVFTVLRWLSPFILMGCVTYLIYKIFFGKY